MAVRFGDQRYYCYNPYNGGRDTTTSGGGAFHNPRVYNKAISNGQPGQPERVVSGPKNQNGSDQVQHIKVRFEEPSVGPKKTMMVKNVRSVDEAADNFIKAKHRSFELRAWDTFKK